MGEEPWHLDKRVPVALIVTIISQFAVTVWMVSAMSSDIETLKLSDMRQNSQIETMRDAAQQMAVSLGRIEEISLNTQKAVEALGRQLEAMP